MKNFRDLMALFTATALFTVIFGALMYRDLVLPIRSYEIGAGDFTVIIPAAITFIASICGCRYLLAQAFMWLMLVRQFKREFGFNPPDHPLYVACLPYENLETVHAILASLHRIGWAQKYSELAILAERFGFVIDWPVEYRQEHQRTRSLH